MSSPLPPLPGETPEQRRARLNAAYAVQARIDAQRQAELEAQEEARRKEMQARIDNMLRSAYVLPPLPQLPVGVGSGSGVGPAPVGPAPVGPAPVKTTRPDPNVIQPTIVTADGRVPNPAYTADVAMQRYRAELLNNNYYSPQERQQIMSSIENAYAQPGATGQQVNAAYQNASAAATRARPQVGMPSPPPIPTYYDPVPPPIPTYYDPVPPPIPTYYDPVPPVEQPTLPPITDIVTMQPAPPKMMEPMPLPQLPKIYEPPRPPVMPPVDPGFVMDIPTFQPPVMPPTMVPPPLQNLGEVLQRIQQKQPPEMPPVDPGFVIGPREPAGPIPTYYDPAPPMLAPPAQPSAGMGLSRLAPEPYTPPVFEPYTPPMAEPYTPPSMQFAVDMPRMNYARDLYGVIPDNVSMLKRGGLAVKPKKGKC